MTLADPLALSRLAEAAAPLMSPADPPAPLRRFSTWEVVTHMLPVANGHLRRVLRETPDLPQGAARSESATRWFTLEEVARLRAHFARHGDPRKSYLPPRPATAPVVVCAGAAGTGRTHLALHLAVAALLEGRRVLALDLDPGGDLSRALGPSRDTSGAMPVLARHHAAHLQAENRARLGRGDRPLPLDEALARALEMEVGDLLCASRWPGLSLMPVGPDLAQAELQIAQWRMDAPAWPFWAALRDRLERDGTRSRHDLIVIDTPAGLGQVTMTALGAADAVLVPCPARGPDIAATRAWLAGTAEGLAATGARHAELARALGTPAPALDGPAPHLVITRHDDASDAPLAAAMQAAFGPALLAHRMPETALIGPGRRCFYDVDYREPGRTAYAPLRAGFDAVYDDLKQVLSAGGRQFA